MQHRILIIDDEDDIREVAAMSLETVAGWEVMVANSGAQGFPAPPIPARRHPAGCDDARHGWAHYLSRAAQQSRHGAHSGAVAHCQGAGPDRRSFADLGVQAVLVKPFDPMTLSAQIAAVLGWD